MRDTSGMSQWAKQAVAKIDAGQAGFQRKRDFERKLAMTLGQTGFTAGTALMKKSESDDLQERQDARAKKAQLDAAIRAAKLPPSHPDDTPRDEYGLEVARPSYAGAMDNAVSRGAPQPLHSQPFSTPDTQELAKNVMASNDANDAATSAPIAGRWTDRGFADADMNASVNASDIDRSKAMMRQAGSFGGLGNSFNGGQ